MFNTIPWSGTNTWSYVHSWPRTFRQGSIESLYIDVYVSQSEMHILHRAGNEGMKTRTLFRTLIHAEK